MSVLQPLFHRLSHITCLPRGMIAEAPVHVYYDLAELSRYVDLWLGNGWVDRCHRTHHLFTNNFDSCWRSRLQELLLL